jgi:hypothetical protein
VVRDWGCALSDLALARSFLEHARDHAKHLQASLNLALSELDAGDTKYLSERFVLVRHAREQLDRRLDLLLDGIDALQKAHPPPAA